jgi:BlaI family transcriptional regulator, penicillinase repressor
MTELNTNSPAAAEGVQAGRRKSKPELTEAEWAIMKVVWENEPCAAGTVQEILQQSKNWAYSTVKGAMDRLAEKGFLKISKIRNLQLFSSTLSQEQAQKGEFKKILKIAFDDALTPMMQFLLENEDFSSDDLKQMRLMIEQAEKNRKSEK